MAGLGDAMISEEAHGTTASVPKSSKPKVIDRISIEVADNGGVTVTCSCKSKGGEPSYSPDKKMAFEDPSAALEYIAGELGVEAAPEEEEPVDEASASGPGYEEALDE